MAPAHDQALSTIYEEIFYLWNVLFTETFQRFVVVMKTARLLDAQGYVGLIRDGREAAVKTLIT